MNSVNYLEKDLDCSINHTHPPAEESEERDDEFDKVVRQGLKAMEPPRRAVNVVGHGIGNWLGLHREKTQGQGDKCHGSISSLMNGFLPEVLQSFSDLQTFSKHRLLTA